MTHPTVTPELVEQVARAFIEGMNPKRSFRHNPHHAEELAQVRPGIASALAQAAPIIAAQARAEALEEAAKAAEEVISTFPHLNKQSHLATGAVVSAHYIGKQIRALKDKP